MKKYLLIFTLLFSLAYPNVAKGQAVGQFKCQNQGGLCVAVNVSCTANYIPNFPFCASIPIAQCDSVPNAACIPQNPTGTTYKCMSPGAGSCVPCATGETCSFTDAFTCANSASCKVVNPPPPGGGGGDTTMLQGKCPNKVDIETGIGCVPIGDLNSFAAFFLRWGMGIAGGIGMLFLVFASFQIITSQGDPKRLQTGKELLTSAISGIILLVFSVFILRILGVNILGIF